MRTALLLLLFPLLAAGLAAQSDSTRLAAVIADYGEWTSAADTGPWRRTTDSTVAADLAALRELRTRVPAPSSLSSAQRIDRDLLVFVLDDAIYQLAFGAHRFPLDAEGGFLTGVVYGLLGQRVTDAEAYADYRRRLAALPAYFAHQQTLLRAGKAAGKTDPRLVVDNCLAQIERTLATPPDQSIFVRPVADQPERRADLIALTRDSIYPAYRALRSFLTEEYLPDLRGGFGIAEITDGKEYYRQRVRYFTTFDVTPEEVFATGQREVARIRAEMDSVIARTGFVGTFDEFLAFLRTDSQFYARTPEELLRRAAWITKRMEGRLPQYFNHLPRMPLTVAPVPEVLAPNYTGGRYSPGSYRQRRAGAFWVNTYDLPSRPLYVLPALALHEGAPGHHTQMMIAAELTGQADFRRNLYLSAFGEGWALYCEYLGREAGIYETPYEEFGRLVYEMWRACRLVVDPGIHYFGWSRERAVAFMAGHTALSLHEVNTEIDRYIGWPGQAVSYKMGELRIRELRRTAELALGDRFELAAFHDLVLSNGAVTMDTLDRLVREWIAGQE